MLSRKTTGSFLSHLGLALVGLLLVMPSTAEAQIWKKVKDKVKERVDQQIEATVDATLTAVECAASDAKCIEAARREGKPVQAVDASGKPLSAEANVWVNYDFTPGDRVIFFEDFAADRVGDFPRRFELKNGTVDVVERDGERFLRAPGFAEVVIVLPENLPDRFTIEFDFIGPANNHQYLYFGEKTDGPHVYFRPNEGGFDNADGVRALADAPGTDPRREFPVRVMVDGDYAKVYMGGTRVANMPRSRIFHGRTLMFQLHGRDEFAAFVGNIRIAAGGRPLFDALSKDGRVATQGILFDTGSDAIQPESTPTLTEIGRMLQENPDLRLVIEGHTDAAGDDAANLQLSERRAQAVKQFLVDRFEIAADRINALGVGEARPLGSNDSSEGRQQNRRVELVRK